MEVLEWALLLVVAMFFQWGFSVHQVRTDVEATEPDASVGAS
jgi:hypothetical protein